MARTGKTIQEDLYFYYYDKLKRIVTNLFVWENVPESIEVDYLESVLTTEGKALFFYDETLGHVALATTPHGKNIYNKFIYAKTDVATTDLTIQKEYNRTIYYGVEEQDINKYGVLINNMYDGIGLLGTVEHFAKRLARVQQAIDTNILWQNIPVIFYTDDHQIRLSIEKFFDNIEKGKPFVIQDKALFRDRVPEPTPTQVEFISDKLEDYKISVMSEFIETIGLNSVGQEKKERLITDEVNANNELLETSLSIMLSQREKAVELINQLFDLDISVKFRGGDKDGPSNDRVKRPIIDRLRTI